MIESKRFLKWNVQLEKNRIALALQKVLLCKSSLDSYQISKIKFGYGRSGSISIEGGENGEIITLNYDHEELHLSGSFGNLLIRNRNIDWLVSMSDSFENFFEEMVKISELQIFSRQDAFIWLHETRLDLLCSGRSIEVEYDCVKDPSPSLFDTLTKIDHATDFLETLGSDRRDRDLFVNFLKKHSKDFDGANKFISLKKNSALMIAAMFRIAQFAKLLTIEEDSTDDRLDACNLLYQIGLTMRKAGIGT